MEAKRDDLRGKTDEELEDTLMDLCGRLTLDNKQVQLLYAVEEERERRQSGEAGREKNKRASSGSR